MNAYDSKQCHVLMLCVARCIWNSQSCCKLLDFNSEFNQARLYAPRSPRKKLIVQFSVFISVLPDLRLDSNIILITPFLIRPLHCLVVLTRFLVMRPPHYWPNYTIRAVNLRNFLKPVNCYQITAVNRLTEILLKNLKINFYAFSEMIVLPFCCLNCDFFCKWEYTAYFNYNELLNYGYEFFIITVKYITMQLTSYLRIL